MSGPPRPNESGRASVALPVHLVMPVVRDGVGRRVHEGRNTTPEEPGCQERGRGGRSDGERRVGVGVGCRVSRKLWVLAGTGPIESSAALMRVEPRPEARPL